MRTLSLALTTIGDLLIRNKITKDGDGRSSEVHLTIPNYQRPYKWTAKNANQLLDDIIEAKTENKETYRVGTLILHHDKKEKADNEERTSDTVDGQSNGAEECWNIVDGQQRAITFALLLKALDDTVNIEFLSQSMPANEYNTNNIPSNYMALKRRIEKTSENERIELKTYIENNCEMIVVITDDISEAFQFFDSQNARGKKLYPHDLLKAYHLREMRALSTEETEKVVKMWEDLDQKDLSDLFCDYLYRVKEWVKGNRAEELNEHNMDMFKGVAAKDNYPYACFYKGAFAYADDLNRSSIPFVTGIHRLNPFQIDTPIVAGKPFFDYAKHYFTVLKDIQNNDKYEGCFINDNEIVKTLDQGKYRSGTGNRITRLLFDSAILLYVDRFCSDHPTPADLDLLDQFVQYAFIWAYSMRAQYSNVGWQVAQNFILGNSKRENLVNSFNLYKTIGEANSPVALLSTLANVLAPIPDDKIAVNAKPPKDSGDKVTALDENGVYKYYLGLFVKLGYRRDQ